MAGRISCIHTDATPPMNQVNTGKSSHGDL